ncbi:ATP-grasp fold amidoligase family protein [Georgenia sunbinii]|uniref:ATP-grasp fold amidoligase family protein n=1 Tax=Georgenia sunbinii TaxID=3117728 RepID=UPI002F26CF06
MLRDMLRRWRPIAWREARIAELRTTVADLRATVAELRTTETELQTTVTGQQRRIDDLRAAAARAAATPPRYQPAVASWHARVKEQQRVQRAVNELDDAQVHARRHLFLKLHNYEVARGHGVATPQVLGVWSDIGDVAWDTLPDEFVLKSNSGSTSRGVLPLERHAGGFRLVDGSRSYTAEEIVAHYADAQGARPPYFAETLLPGSDITLPDDVKIYAFYGRIAFVLIRRMPVHGDTALGQLRILAPTGEDLQEVLRGRTSDETVPVPAQLALMLDTAAALSLALPVPVVRVDLYAAGDDGVVLGELTPLPGDSHTFTRDWDRRLGEMYDDAEARLQVDLTNGRPFEVLHGTHDRGLTAVTPPTTRAPARPGWDVRR